MLFQIFKKGPWDRGEKSVQIDFFSKIIGKIGWLRHYSDPTSGEPEMDNSGYLSVKVTPSLISYTSTKYIFIYSMWTQIFQIFHIFNFLAPLSILEELKEKSIL